MYLVLLIQCRFMSQLLSVFLPGNRFDNYSSAYVEPVADGDDPYDRIIVSGTKVSPTPFIGEHKYQGMA